MAKVPVCSGEDAIAVFRKSGWLYGRTKGSHVTLYKPSDPVVLTVPLHKVLDRGLLAALIKKSGLTVDKFVRLLNS